MLENRDSEDGNHSADLGRRALAYELMCDKIHLALTPKTWDVWIRTQDWIQKHLPTTPQLKDYKIDHAFIAFQYYGVLPTLDWIEAVEEEVPGAKEVLKIAFTIQKSVFDAGGDGASAQKSSGRFS